MKAFVTAPVVASRSIGRVAEALAKYAPPSVEIVAKEADADLVVLHVIGRRDQMLAKAREILKRGARYAVAQYVLRSTQKPSPDDWFDFWIDSAVVWSYLDLVRAITTDDLSDHRFEELAGSFYHSPLGVESDVFRPSSAVSNQYVIGTSGQSWLTESVRECVVAAEKVGRRAWHLGGELGRRAVDCKSGIADYVLADYYRASSFVSGLRRIEGFELPAAEGLLCGARPLLFANSSGYDWYKPWGIFIEETDRQGVIDQLVPIFRAGAKPVTAEERAAAAERFNWKTIVQEFWRRAL